MCTARRSLAWPGLPCLPAPPNPPLPPPAPFRGLPTGWLREGWLAHGPGDPPTPPPPTPTNKDLASPGSAAQGISWSRNAGSEHCFSVPIVFLPSVPGRPRSSEHAFFPEASPENTVGTLRRNTIGTLNQCSEPAVRDQLRILRMFVGIFDFWGDVWGRDPSGELRLAKRCEKCRRMVGSVSESVGISAEQLRLCSVGLGTRVRNSDLVFR